jgi:hypothetical protein
LEVVTTEEKLVLKDNEEAMGETLRIKLDFIRRQIESQYKNTSIRFKERSEKIDRILQFIYNFQYGTKLNPFN